MSQISITRKHGKTMKDAKVAVNHLAKAMNKKFAVDHEWDGDTLSFARSGVSGQIALSKGVVKVDVKLGFLLMALKSSVESEIERVLDEQFT